MSRKAKAGWCILVAVWIVGVMTSLLGVITSDIGIVVCFAIALFRSSCSFSHLGIGFGALIHPRSGPRWPLSLVEAGSDQIRQVGDHV